jgi:hypothetical protein
LGRHHELFGNEPTHFVAAAVWRTDANLIENILEARLKSCGDFAHKCTDFVGIRYF